MNAMDHDNYDKAPDLNADMRKRVSKKRACQFCGDSAICIDYKDTKTLKYFISERGKIVPRRISGNCALHQRKITVAVKRARNIALLPFTVTNQ